MYTPHIVRGRGKHTSNPTELRMCMCDEVQLKSKKYAAGVGGMVSFLHTLESLENNNEGTWAQHSNFAGS